MDMPRTPRRPTPGQLALAEALARELTARPDRLRVVAAVVAGVEGDAAA